MMEDKVSSKDEAESTLQSADLYSAKLSGFERLYLAAQDQQAHLNELRAQAVEEARAAQNMCKMNPYSLVLENRRLVNLLRETFNGIDRYEEGVIKHETMQVWINDLWELGGLAEHFCSSPSGEGSGSLCSSPSCHFQLGSPEKSTLEVDISNSPEKSVSKVDQQDSGATEEKEAHEQARESAGDFLNTTQAHLEGKCNCLDDVTSQVLGDLLGGESLQGPESAATAESPQRGVSFKDFCRVGLRALGAPVPFEDASGQQPSPLLVVFFHNSLDLLDSRRRLEQQKASELWGAQAQLTFQPQLTKRSDKLDPFRKELMDCAVQALAEGQTPMRRVSLWQEKRMQYLYRMQEAHYEKMEKEGEGCTFHPDLLAKQRKAKSGKCIEIYDAESHRMEKVAVADLPVFDRLALQLYGWGSRVKDDATTSEKEFDDHCTFSPNIKRSKHTFAGSKEPEFETSFLFREHVNRMKAAREWKRNAEAEANRQIYTDESYQKSRELGARGPQPFHLSQRFELPKPRAIIKVLGKPRGKERTIALREGDVPSEVVRSFAKSFQIGKKNEEQLLKYIISVMEKCNIPVGTKT